MEIILKLEDSLTTVERYETLFDDIQDVYNLDLIHIHINFQFNAKENKIALLPYIEAKMLILMIISVGVDASDKQIIAPKLTSNTPLQLEYFN